MGEHQRSEQTCPVCSQHSLAIDEPPQIDVMGVQAYSDMLGMGDLHQGGTVGIVCLDCGTRWRDKAAFDRGEAEPAADSFADDGDAGGGGGDDGDAGGGGGDDGDAGGGGGDDGDEGDAEDGGRSGDGGDGGE